MELKNIKTCASRWKDRIKAYLTSHESEPRLEIIQVGDNESSDVYIKNKKRDCEEVGIKCNVWKFPGAITQDQLIGYLRGIILDNPTGIIVQMPLPEHIDKDAIANIIPDRMDVDGFRPSSPFKPCTPSGIIHYLKECEFEFAGADVVVIGRSDVVGKPLAQMLTDLDCTVTLAHSKTKGLSNYIANADLVICAVGKYKFLNCYPIHCPVIDVGINVVYDGGKRKVVGDCFNTEKGNVTPVPNGVGLLTRCALLENILSAVE